MDITDIARFILWIRCVYANAFSLVGVLFLIAGCTLTYATYNGDLAMFFGKDVPLPVYLLLIMLAVVGWWLVILTGCGMHTYDAYLEAMRLRSDNPMRHAKRAKGHRKSPFFDYCGSVGYRLENMDYIRDC